MPKCWRDPDHRGTAVWTPPDGFCKWGKRDKFVTCKCGEEIEAFGRLQTCPSCGRTVMA